MSDTSPTDEAPAPITDATALAQLARRLLGPADEWKAPIHLVGAAADVAQAYLDLLDGAADLERATRKNERQRLAALFEGNAQTLATFAPDGLSIEMLAFLLRLDHG